MSLLVSHLSCGNRIRPSWGFSFAGEVSYEEMFQEKYVSVCVCVLSKESILYGAGIIVTIKREVNIFMDFFMGHFNCIQLFLMSCLARQQSHSFIFCDNPSQEVQRASSRIISLSGMYAYISEKYCEFGNANCS